jgi:hypothetical protein
VLATAKSPCKFFLNSAAAQFYEKDMNIPMKKAVAKAKEIAKEFRGLEMGLPWQGTEPAISMKYGGNESEMKSVKILVFSR